MRRPLPHKHCQEPSCGRLTREAAWARVESVEVRLSGRRDDDALSLQPLQSEQTISSTKKHTVCVYAAERHSLICQV